MRTKGAQKLGQSKSSQKIAIRVCALIVNRDGKILLAEHEREGRRYLVFPGGKVEFGEPLEGALRRELREEAGMDVEVLDLIGVGEFISPEEGRHVLDLLFLALPKGEEISPVKEGVFKGAKWYPQEALLSEEVRPRQLVGRAWEVLREGKTRGGAWIRKPYGQGGKRGGSLEGGV